ncbi:MAG: cell wall metabolism sensor histidine kinase WalK [Clostridiales bacterium]|nr:cell wall metabolism sensor histidine kinase WalK [Clostridiales bacterium]
MKYRKDDLIGIRKARFASFVLLLVCFASMLVILVLSGGGTQAYIASSVVIAILVLCWWFFYRQILFGEAVFYDALSTDMDIRERRLLMLDSTVSRVPDGIVIVAEDGSLILVNETAKKLLAVFDGDIDEARYDEYVAGIKEKAFSEKLERAMILEAARDGRPSVTVSVDGQHYNISYVALVQEKDKKRGAVVLISDVTENTKAEKMQIDFVVNVSHELKTPLASVKSYAETLMTGAVDDPETTQEFLNIIVSEADRMDRLVKGLLSLARLESEGSAMETFEIDLPSLTMLSMKKLDIVAKEKALSVNQMFSDNLRIPVEINRDRIEQVIHNILSNAIDYTDEKGRVDVDIIKGQNCVQIVISDNGIGIPEEDLAHVFERLYMVDKARTGRMGGTGLGLAISRDIVIAHGGTIGIESKLGRGTTVTVTLPASRPRGIPGIL